MNGATKTIWKTVVFAGAMLGTAACGGQGKKAEPTTPATTEAAGDSGNTSAETPDTTAADPCAADPCAADPCAGDPCADPCGGRPRGVSDEGDVGRGFLLS